MASLNGIRVALLEARMSSELAGLVERHGGTPYCVPAVREATMDADEEIGLFIDRITAGSFQVVIFLTGVGVRRLFDGADRLGRLTQLLDALKKVTTVCRGPKPIAVLKKIGVQVNLSAPEPNTTTELLKVLEHVSLEGIGVALQHYGERNAVLADALLARGARLEEITLYEWLLPDDTGPLKDLVREIVVGRVDAIAFTSQIQIRHLFQIAEGQELREQLADAMNGRIVVASVGPICTTVLHSFGVAPHVVPEHPKMGPMVVELARYIEEAGARPACRL